MKKLIIILLLFTSARSFGQGFPTTDSLHRYDNRFITNSAINSFTDYRLNTLIHGIINWIDSARLGTGGTVGMDTLYTVNDSTFRYKKNGLFFTFTNKGVYDTRRKADTLYRVNDSTIGYTINGQARSFIIRGNGSGGGGGSPASPDKSIQFRQNSTTFGAATATWDSALNLFPKNKYSTAAIPSLKYNGLVHNIIDTASAYQIDNIRSYDPRWGNWYHFTSIFPNAAGGTINPSENFVWSNGYNVSKNGRVIDTLQAFSFNFETNFPTASDSTAFSELYWTHSPVTTGSPQTLEDRRIIFWRMSNGRGLGSRKYENTVFGSSMTQQFWYEWRDSTTQTMQQYFTISQGGIVLAGNYNSNIPAISINTRTNPNHSTPDPIFYYRSNPIISVGSDSRSDIQIGGSNNQVLLAGKQLKGNVGVGPQPFYITQGGGGPIQIGDKDFGASQTLALGTLTFGFIDSTNTPDSHNASFTRPDGDVRLSLSHITSLEYPAFSFMALGGTASTNPALKRSSALLQVRLGDDSKLAFMEGKGEVYGSGWNGDSAFATKADLYNKIESLGGGGVSDGDKGDITVSSSASVFTIDNDVVTFAKMANMNTNKLLGRSTASSGDPEEISIGSGLSLSGGTLTASGGSGSPGGSSTQIQYNNSGAFAGSANLVWDNTNGRVGIGTSSPSDPIHISDAQPVIRLENQNDGSLTRIMGLNGNAFGINRSAGWVMYIDPNGFIGIGGNNTGPVRLFHPQDYTSTTNAIRYSARFGTMLSSGTATTGYGSGIELSAQNASGTEKVQASIETPYTDATNTSEDADMVLKTMRAGTLTESLRIVGTGALKFNGVPSGIGASLYIGTDSLLHQGVAPPQVVTDSTGFGTVTATTTNATPTDIISIPISNGQVFMIYGDCLAQKSGNDAGFIASKMNTFLKNGGSMVTGTPVVIMADNYPTLSGGLSTATFTITNNGTTGAVIKVTGEASTTITWKIRYRIVSK